MRNLAYRTALIACLLPPIAACGKPAPNLLNAAAPPTQDGSVDVAVVDAPVRQGDIWSCFDVAASADNTAPTKDVVHGEQVLAAVLGLPSERCPDWAHRVDVRAYSVGATEAPNHADVATAIHAAAEDGADLINVSIAFRRDFDDVREAAAAARDQGAVIVAAAGNHAGLAAGYPARYDGVVSVGSGSPEGSTSPFSAGSHLDVVAPGEDVAVVDAAGNRSKASGTSLAAAVFSSRMIENMLTGQSAREAAEDLAPSHQQEEGKNQ